MSMIDREWLESCAQAGEFLYGAYPVEVLKELYETKAGYLISEAEAVREVQGMPSLLMEYIDNTWPEFENMGYRRKGYFLPRICDEGTPMYEVMVQAAEDGNGYTDLHLDPRGMSYLFEEQMDVEFYIPTEEEIRELIDLGHIRTPAMTELEKHLQNPEYAAQIWPLLSTDTIDFNDAVSEAMSHMKMPAGADIDDLNHSIRYFTEFCNSVNLRARRGWRPRDLRLKMGDLGMPTTIVPGSVQAAKMMKQSEGQLRTMGIDVSYDSLGKFETIGEHGERRVMKVGRNDPCPCGSGKKFKKCCGR